MQKTCNTKILKIIIFILILSFNYLDASLPNDCFLKTDLNGSVSQRNKNSDSGGFGYTFSLGYKFNNLVTAMLEAGFRFGHIRCIDVDDTSFNLSVSNTSVLADLYLYGEGMSKYLVLYFTDCFKLQPFIGTGLGISINKAENFFTKLNGNGSIDFFENIKVSGADCVYPKSRNCSWAAQALVGLELSYKYFALGTGYRYFDGGRFKQNNYLVSKNINDNMFVLVDTIPFTSRFRTHELFFYFNFSADF